MFTRCLRLFLLQRLCPGQDVTQFTRSANDAGWVEEQTLTKPRQLCPVLLVSPTPRRGLLSPTGPGQRLARWPPTGLSSSVLRSYGHLSKGWQFNLEV